MKKQRFLNFIVLFAILLSVPSSALPSGNRAAAGTSGEDVVLQWNRVLMETVIIPGQQPSSIAAARSFAMMHAAMYDAINSIDGSHTPYLIDVPRSKNASIQAAAAQAAFDVLSALFPNRVAVFEEELAASLEDVRSNRARQGIYIGRQAAAAILAARSDDGWTATPPPYVLDMTPGNWQPTPSAPAAFTHYPGVRPFALLSSSQFIPPPPPALNSPEYAAAFNEVKEIGSATSTTRTADQTQQAQVWASVGNPIGVAVLWNRIGRDLALSQGTSTVDNARLFALLNFALHDGLQTSFASKFYYGLWRPVTAIRRADEDDNADTEADPTWNSLIGNPPYPTYAGNNSAIAASQAGILTLFFGRDDLAVQYTFPGNITRSYASLSAIADEAARSREYGGIHFRFDSVAGQSIGINTSNYIYLNLLKPR